MEHDNLLNSLSLVFCLSVSSILAFSGSAEAIGLEHNGDRQAHANPLTEMTESSARSDSPVIFHDRFKELPDLTAEEATQAFDELARRTGEFIEDAFAEAQGSEGSTSAFIRETEVFDIDFDQGCSDGGTVSMAGSIMVTAGDGNEQTTDMNLSLDYAACDEQGVVIDGHLSYESSVWHDGNDMEMSLAISGQLDFSGEIEDSCGIGVSIEVSVEELDGGQLDVQVNADGNFCGFDFDDLDTQIADSDQYGGGP